MNILKEIEGVFIPPKKNYYIGEIVIGSPYFTPCKFNSSILSIRKKNSIVKRNKCFSLFGYDINYGWPVSFIRSDLGWKTKWGSVRYEWPPFYHIYFFKWQFCISWDAPDNNNDLYYEMILWYLYCSNKDIVKAKETWGWINCETKESTWNDKYIIK